jgi:hypothetical protein
MKINGTLVALALFAGLLAVFPASGARVEHEKDKVFIVDQLGERWDVTQAKSLGFIPSQFQYGIGRHTFKTLNDGHLDPEPKYANDSMRVIGIAEGEEAKAWSVRKLSRHEIANSSIGGDAIAVGY